jgi:hypothetical protein
MQPPHTHLPHILSIPALIGWAIVIAAGKAPIADADESFLLAAQETIAATSGAAGSGSSGKVGLLPKLGQLLGFKSAVANQQMAAAAAAAATDAGVGSAARVMPNHLLQPVFHPSRTQRGTQPTLVIPQVGVIKVICHSHLSATIRGCLVGRLERRPLLPGW